MPIDSAARDETPAAEAVAARIRDARPVLSDRSDFAPGVHDPAATFTAAQNRLAERLVDHGASVAAIRPQGDGPEQPDATIRWDASRRDVPAVFEELPSDASPATIEERIRAGGRLLGDRRGEVAFLTPAPGVKAYDAHLGYHRAVTGGGPAPDQVHFVTEQEVFSLSYEVAREEPQQFLDDMVDEDYL